ncbi:tetratricopeptide repeat protein [Streptomyces cellulosae]|nr:tetratricopeptide repeat protein [Streptomyces cellulosae]
MTEPEAGTTGDGAVRNNTFHGTTVIQTGAHSTQNIQLVYQSKPAYRIENFPAAPSRVRPGALATQPSQLLRAAHQVVPFTSRHADLEALTAWREDPGEELAVRLVHGPGGQGKTRLAAHFADLSRQAGWTVWQAALNDAGTKPVPTGPPPLQAGAGVLLIIDYAERWPTPDLRALLQEPALHHSAGLVRILLLARPAGIWWDSLETWIDDTLNAPAQAHPLPPLAQDRLARASLFQQARDRFADHLGLPVDQSARIEPPTDLDTDEDYAQVLTIHIAALAAVDARLHHERPPTDPARASAYLLKRERAHWKALHERTPGPLSTTPEAMRRCVFTATLTRPLARTHGWDALYRVGLADTREAANTLLDDHQYCYPTASPITVLEPLYPDRLGEDYLGLTTPPSPDDPDASHPVPGTKTDDWAWRAAHDLLAPDAETNTLAPWTRNALTVLIETSRRWPHIATGQLYPLLKKHPQLALQAGGIGLAALASLDDLDIAVLEAIEPHLPTGRNPDLDIGIAAVADRLARHNLAITQDPLAHATTNARLAVHLSYAGLRTKALTAGQAAVEAWRSIIRSDPSHVPDLALSLYNLSTLLSEVGQQEKALSAAEEAVEIRRRLAEQDPAAYELKLAESLAALGARLSLSGGRQGEGLAATEEAMAIYRRWLADISKAREVKEEPAVRDPEESFVTERLDASLAAVLSNYATQLSGVERWPEALEFNQLAVDFQRELAERDPATHEHDLARSLLNLSHLLSIMRRKAEALSAAEEVVEIRRRLAAVNPAAYEPDLAAALSSLSDRLSEEGRHSEAVSAVEEAVEIRRRLTEAEPAAYEHDLVRTLVDLSYALAEEGRPAEALSAAEEVVEIRRRLAAVNPAAYEPDLAAALSSLSDRLSEEGRHSEAVSAVEGAVEIRRRLAEAEPAAYEHDLVRTLIKSGFSLLEVGRQADALSAANEAVEIYWRLTRLYSDTGESDVSYSLGLASTILTLYQQGRSDADVEMVTVYKDHLARLLSSLNSSLPEALRQAEALSKTREEVKKFQQLAAVEPEIHESELAASLASLGVKLWMTGRRFEALAATMESLSIEQRLAEADPAAFEPHFARKLSLTGSMLSELGREGDALRLTELAVKILLRLAKDNSAAHESDLAKRCPVTPASA